MKKSKIGYLYLMTGFMTLILRYKSKKKMYNINLYKNGEHECMGAYSTENDANKYLQYYIDNYMQNLETSLKN